MNATITNCTMSCPDGWAPLPATVPYPDGWTEDWDAEVAAQLAPGKVSRLRKALRRLHPGLTAEPHQMVGIWVPDPDHGEIAGHVVLDWLLGEPGQPVTREYYRTLIEPDQRTLTVFARTIDDINLPAGPALQIQEVVAPSPSGPLEERLEYVVFPPGVQEAVDVIFVLHGVSVDEDYTFEEHALASIDTLAITIGASS